MAGENVSPGVYIARAVVRRCGRIAGGNEARARREATYARVCACARRAAAPRRVITARRVGVGGTWLAYGIAT